MTGDGTTPSRPPLGGMPADGWEAWLTTYGAVVAVAAATLPFAMLAIVALARRRAVTTTPARAWRTAVLDVGIVYGTVPFVWMTMLPGSQVGIADGQVSLVPLRDLATMSRAQVVGNLLIFAAFGLLAPLRYVALASLGRVVVVAAGGSILIETAQYVLRLDRVSSVDDVLLNAAGAGLAALVTRPWWLRRTSPPSRRTAVTSPG